MYKVLVHTDIILQHLLHDKNSKSILREAQKKVFCYTTVFNAIEIFSICKESNEFYFAQEAMSSMKILGLNSKNAKVYGKMYGENSLRSFNTLIATLSLESKLPILTTQPKEFKGTNVSIISSADIFKYETAEEIINLNKKNKK